MLLEVPCFELIQGFIFQELVSGPTWRESAFTASILQGLNAQVTEKIQVKA